MHFLGFHACCECMMLVSLVPRLYPKRKLTGGGESLGPNLDANSNISSGLEIYCLMFQ